MLGRGVEPFLLGRDSLLVPTVFFGRPGAEAISAGIPKFLKAGFSGRGLSIGRRGHGESDGKKFLSINHQHTIFIERDFCPGVSGASDEHQGRERADKLHSRIIISPWSFASFLHRYLFSPARQVRPPRKKSA